MPTLARNKKAFFDYEILERFEAGLVLSGQEVKSAKIGNMSLKGAFVTIHGNELYLTNATISRYSHSDPASPYDPTQSRKLLVHRREIRQLIGKMRTDRLTMVPLSVYTKGRYVKIECALVRGKKKFDKRQTIKKHDADRSALREIRSKI